MPNRARVLATILPMAVVLGGCLFESTIDAKGGAEIKLHYRVDRDTTVEQVVKDLESKDVKVVSKAIDKDYYVDATLQTADVTKLSTSTFFKTTTIVLADGPDQGTKKLTVRYGNAKPIANIQQDVIDYYGNQVKVVLNLPGDVVKTNATETKGASATWVFDTKRFQSETEILFEVTYKLAK